MRPYLIVLMLCIASCDPNEGNDGPPTEQESGSEGTNADGESDGQEEDSQDVGDDSDVSSDDADDTDETGSSASGNESDSGNESGGDSESDSGNESGGENSETDLETETETPTPSVTCPEGSELHVSAQGETFCCPESYPVFCDAFGESYPGGCWSKDVDCASITRCGDDWSACHQGDMPYCDPEEGLTCYPCEDPDRKVESSSGRPFCCTEEHPLFCDENSDGYKGGCWSTGIDCSTLIECNGYWGACLVGLTSSCPDGGLTCLPVEG